MKRSEYREKRIVHHEQAMGYYCRGGASAEGRTAVLRADLDIEAAEAAGVTWDPEEPEGFREWWEQQPVIALKARALCLSAWNACLARQEAQQRTIEPEVDPEVRRKEIEAQIESWAGFIFRGGVNQIRYSRRALEGDAKNLLRRLGVL